MKKEVAQLAKHSGIYGVGVILSKSVGFLMLPVYTHVLKPSDYGILELLDLITFFAGIFASVGILTAVFRFYSAYESERDRMEVISTAQLCNAGLSLVVTVLILLFAPFLADRVLGDRSLAPFVRIVALTLFSQNLAEVPLAYLRARGRTVTYVCVGLARTVFSVTLIILFLLVLKQGVRGVLIANLLSAATAGLVLFGYVAAKAPLKLSVPKLKQMLRFGVPIVPSSLVQFLLIFSDRFFLRHFANLNEVGVYSLGYKLAGIVSILVSGPLAMSWAWQQFELAKKPEGPELYAKLQVYRLLISVFVGLAISIFARDILHIMTGQEYWAASRVVPLIVLSYVLTDMRAAVNSGILVKGVTFYLPIVGIFSAVSNLALNYFLVSQYWAIGAALATVLSYAIHLALTYIVSQRVYKVPYDYRRNAVTFAAATMIYFVCTLYGLPMIASIGVKLLALILFACVCLRLLDRSEREMFRQLARGLARRIGMSTVQA